MEEHLQHAAASVRALTHDEDSSEPTSAQKLHDKPKFVLDNKGSVVGDNVWVVTLTHGMDLFLLAETK